MIYALKRSRSSQPDMASLMTSPEAALRTSPHLAFKIARNDTYKDLLILSWQAVMSEECAMTTDGVASKVQKKMPVK